MLLGTDTGVSVLLLVRSFFKKVSGAGTVRTGVGEIGFDVVLTTGNVLMMLGAMGTVCGNESVGTVWGNVDTATGNVLDTATIGNVVAAFTKDDVVLRSTRNGAFVEGFNSKFKISDLVLFSSGNFVVLFWSSCCGIVVVVVGVRVESCHSSFTTC